ncbi:MAG: amino acid permease [Leptospiraceae bacterium]|nr:amino acid permease [Leptospiraceae bacterium]
MDSSSTNRTRIGMGTAPVFFTAISTILGAIMFLRFGYAVAHVGLYGAWAIIIIGHCITIPTAMAVSEIATNQRVEGGGEYYIISRSFGLHIGAAIGIALYFSQAISVAFYLIAFAQAFQPLFDWIFGLTGILIQDSRFVSVPALLILFVILYFRGAGSGAALLYVIVFVLFTSLIFFFAGMPESAPQTVAFDATVSNPDHFFKVFAIVFPAFTGMTAGVGLSGDLKNPRRSIPMGTMSATLIGMVIYFALLYKLVISADIEDLASDQLIMSKISAWGPIIPIGLACATISSALGSIMVAPRTLQALAHDRIFVLHNINKRVAHSSRKTREPVNALIITFVIAIVFVLIGDVDVVAQIITMFFMVTYGSLCLISFMEHFAADPAYRPTFKSRWWISLPGALLCFWMMFQISTLFAAVAAIVMTVLYLLIVKYNPGQMGLAAIFQGAMFQVARRLQVFLQKSRSRAVQHWRPFVICLSARSFERYDAIEMLRWISHKYGFGTYIHYINGYLSRSTRDEADAALERLVHIADISKSNVYFSIMVSPSYTTAIAQVLQLPGISGQENNMILFEYNRDQPEELEDIIDNFPLIKAKDFDILILGSSPRKFGYKREIHIWITENDYANANLMVLLAYILLGHPQWEGGFMKIFDVCSQDKIETENERLQSLIRAGRLPISTNHVELIRHNPDLPVKDLVNKHSVEADLVIVGVREEILKHQRSVDVFSGYQAVGDILFVNTTESKEI